MPKLSYRRKAAGLLAAFLIAGAASAEYSRRKNEPPRAPLFSLKSISGKEIALKSFQGKVVLLDFWATWCGPCRLSIPSLEKIQEDLGPRGVQVLGVSVDDDPSTLPGFARSLGVRYPVLWDDRGVSAMYGVRGLPTLYLIDKSGRVVNRWVGFDETFDDQIRAEVEKWLSFSTHRSAF